jgi:hypothetical protein
LRIDIRDANLAVLELEILDPLLDVLGYKLACGGADRKQAGSEY